MPGPIQSIERAAAVLRLLGGAGRPLALAELAAALDLPRPTVHGIVATLRSEGLVEQDHASALYRLGGGLRTLASGWDRHDLRARAMNWADVLAGGTGCAVYLAVPEGAAAGIVHHVFRPDGTPQTLRTNTDHPLHATAWGKCLLAFAPVSTPAPRDLELRRYTGRTASTVAMLEAHLAAARTRGMATDVGEFESGAGGAAVPLRSGGGLTVAALGIAAPVEQLFGGGGEPRPAQADLLRAAGREISALLVSR
ncbi:MULTISPECIES: IclR family transcriptional regulator [Pseudonocardia]|uniref:Glycerol operon regulatory protein n=1 Tax=Pseudonocardia oroxyli TaxID=366584 RepID=A0A1G7XK37_PSEOR|nr:MULTISPECIES: helix-turn-helix domain-containing protein [Pseudonocardia]MCF7553494.1 helix-turn-helix domain-containing protein [Pseudonocardia sp. WMMC193]SDG84599.1 transcriptional regulator, IclR family [Pseudonocardia oroxyli]